MRRSEAGLTLLEVLLAVTLLSLLSVGILTTMRMALGALSRTNEHLNANRRVSGAQRILMAQLNGFLPVIAECGANPVAPGSAGVKMPFFQGAPQTLRLVSAYSIQEGLRGFPRVAEFQVIPGVEGRGVRLIVNEHVYTGPKSAGRFCLGPGQFPPVEAGAGSFVLADKLAYCRFTYQETLPPPLLAGPWLPVYAKPGWPRAVRIEMAPLEDEPGRLRPGPVTALLRVDRYPVFEYTDE
jgi:type II secretory pathway pseudopilin PulG